MIIMSLDDFIEEVKGEIGCYDEQGGVLAENWQRRFMELINSKTPPKSIKTDSKGQKVISLKDETELFACADSYIVAVDGKEEDAYFAGYFG